MKSNKNYLSITKAIPSGLITSLEVVNGPIGKLTILTVFCSDTEKEQIMNKAVSFGMPHERFDKGIKLFN